MKVRELGLAVLTMALITPFGYAQEKAQKKNLTIEGRTNNKDKNTNKHYYNDDTYYGYNDNSNYNNYDNHHNDNKISVKKALKNYFKTDMYPVLDRAYDNMNRHLKRQRNYSTIIRLRQDATAIQKRERKLRREINREKEYNNWSAQEVWHRYERQLRNIRRDKETLARRFQPVVERNERLFDDVMYDLFDDRRRWKTSKKRIIADVQYHNNQQDEYYYDDYYSNQYNEHYDDFYTCNDDGCYYDDFDYRKKNKNKSAKKNAPVTKKSQTTGAHKHGRYGNGGRGRGRGNGHGHNHGHNNNHGGHHGHNHVSMIKVKKLISFVLWDGSIRNSEERQNFIIWDRGRPSRPGGVTSYGNGYSNNHGNHGHYDNDMVYLKTLNFNLPRNMRNVTVIIRNNKGRQVKNLNYRDMRRGNHNVKVDVSNLHRGKYYYIVKAGYYTQKETFIIR